MKQNDIFRRIESVEASESFWSDLEGLRRHPSYGELRRALARFVMDLAQGRPVQERGFVNSRLRGVMHMNLTRNMRLFHVYPDEKTLRLCAIADHRVYGFNGKHKKREAVTADRIQRAADSPNCASPGWRCIKWRRPSDIIGHPELHEMSQEGMHDLLDDLDREAETLKGLCREIRVKNAEQIPEQIVDDWLEEIIEAQNHVCTALEERARKRVPALTVEDFDAWMEI